jgi:hypothetical protein
MAERHGGGAPPPAQNPTVKDRWWVDTGDKRREKAPTNAPVASGFYRSAAGFEQDTARARLTDLNMKLLVDGNPPEGGWGYVALIDPPFPEVERERIKNRVALASYARGVVVDSGRSVRILITGTPIGQRVLDLTLGDAPSFDCWVDGEWVREAVFEDADQAIDGLRRFIGEYLSPESIADWEARRARA